MMLQCTRSDFMRENVSTAFAGRTRWEYFHAMLTFVIWVVVGVVAGIAARAVAPVPPKKSKQPSYSPVTILAVLGAIVAGMICDVIVRDNRMPVGIDYLSVLAASLGAVVIIVLARVLEIHVDR